MYILLFFTVLVKIRGNQVLTMSTESTKTCPFCSQTIQAEATQCCHCGKNLSDENAPPPNTDSDDDDEILYGEAAFDYSIKAFIKYNPIKKKCLTLYPDITDDVLGWCGFPLEDGEVPLIAIAQKPWFGMKMCWTALLVTNRHIHYRAVNYYGFRDIFHSRKTESVRWEDIAKLDFDYAYYNYKGGYMGSPFYINGEKKGMIYIPEINWLLIIPIPCVDDQIIDWFQTLFAYLAEIKLLDYAPDAAEEPNAGDVVSGWIGKIIDRF